MVIMRLALEKVAGQKSQDHLFGIGNERMSSQREQIGAQGGVSHATVKQRVRTFLKDMGYSVELIEDAFRLHGPDADLCVQYCAARAPKQTQSVAQPSPLTPMVQQKRDDLRQRLSKNGFRDAYINVAIERCDIDAMSVSSAFTWCCAFIERELDPPGKLSQPLSQAPLPTSWKISSEEEQIGARAAVSEATVKSNLIRTFLKNMGHSLELIEEALKLHGPNTDLCAQYCEARAPKHVTIERCNIDALIDIRAQLKSMGYTDQQVDTAFARGCSDLDVCVQYLMYAESSSEASSHAHAPYPGGGGARATTSSIIVISGDGRQLVNVDCALFNPSPPSTVTLTRLQEYKGWLYRTAHERRVDQKAHASDGMILVDVPFGWDLCCFDADVQHICRMFGWSSHALVLDDGSVCYTTACTGGCNPGS